VVVCGGRSDSGRVFFFPPLLLRFPRHMGNDFSKFQGMLRFALQILPADNLKGFKTQPTTKSAPKTQETN
jgi:hypothetical protein